MTLRRGFAALVTYGILIAGSGVQAGEAGAGAPVVLELFTSQGCSSCPAADALFKSYAGRKDVIALSMPVDYWDYLGWKDTLASPKFSKRQRDYARLRGDGQIYTPQMVVNGRIHVNGASKDAIEAALAATAKSAGGSGVISASLANGTITIDVPRTASDPGDATVWLAVVQAVSQVVVRSGENRGRSLAYYNVVRDLLPLGVSGSAPMSIKQQAAALSGSGDRYAVLLQNGVGGPIVSAAWVDPGK